MLPAAARSHYRWLQQMQLVTVAAVRRAWRTMQPAATWDDQYASSVGPKILAVVAAAQLATTRESDSYVAGVLNELAFGPRTAPGVVPPTALVGTAGDGRPVETLLQQSVIVAGRAYTKARREVDHVGPWLPDAEQALKAAEGWLDQVVQTILADTARATEAAATADRTWVDGWVRMLNPPSCSRCAILAGRFYRWNDGFERHPNCDCIHIPAKNVEHAMAEGLILDVGEYFDGLSAAEQDKVFTNAGAEAIRLGADPVQVVNARRGMRTAQTNPRGWIPKGRQQAVDVFGRPTFITTEGATRRSVWRKSNPASKRPYRLMPESILQIAEDREDARRLLRLYGYLH